MAGRSRRDFHTSRKRNHQGKCTLFLKSRYCLFSLTSLGFLITRKMTQPLVPPHPAHPFPPLHYPFTKQQSQRTGSLWWHHSRQWVHISVYLTAGISVIIQREGLFSMAIYRLGSSVRPQDFLLHTG